MQYASAPRKLSDVNHLRGCLFKRLKELKGEKFRGTHMFTTKVVDCLCKAYRLCVKQNTGNPQRARAQILNLIDHYWGDHSRCQEFNVKDEHGKATGEEEFDKCRARACLNGKNQKALRQYDPW